MTDRRFGDQHFAVMAVKYVAFLAAILVVFGGALFLILRESSRVNADCARFVNLSGRQRMLTQRTALLSFRLARVSDGAARLRLRGELSETVAEMEKFHDFLVVASDMKAGQRMALPAGARDIYFEAPYFLDKNMRRFFVQVKALLAEPDSVLTDDNPFLQAITKMSEDLIRPLDLVVAAWQGECGGHAGRSQTTAFVVLPLAAIAAAVFIFMKR